MWIRQHTFSAIWDLDQSFSIKIEWIMVPVQSQVCCTSWLGVRLKAVTATVLWLSALSTFWLFDQPWMQLITSMLDSAQVLDSEVLSLNTFISLPFFLVKYIFEKHVVIWHLPPYVAQYQMLFDNALGGLTTLKALSKYRLLLLGVGLCKSNVSLMLL